MNNINALCIKLIELNSIKKYNIIKKYKINKEISLLEYKILNEDIFLLSDNIMSFLISSNIYLDNIIINNLYLKFIIKDNIIDYNPKSHVISIKNNNVTYFIIKNNRIPTIIINEWNILNKEIHNFYLDLIIKISNKLSII